MAKGFFVSLASLLVVMIIAANTGPALCSSLSKRELLLDDNYNYNDDQASDGDEDPQNDGDGDTEGEDNEPQGPPAVIISEHRRFQVPVGSDVWLPCEITNFNNDLNVVSWTKGNDSVIYLGNLKTDYGDTRTHKHSNQTLSISKVQESDSGNYTCHIGGTNEKVYHGLEVYVPQAPKVSLRMIPKDQIVRVGSSLEIFCDATGMPEPRIQWRKEIGDSSEVLSSSDIELRPKSIYIANVKREHSAKYGCLADNYVGAPAYNTIQVIVVGEPRVHVPKTIVNGDVGAEAILTCTAHEEPASIITWLKDKVEIESKEGIAIDTVGQKSTLTIFSIEDEDFGNYTCLASNSFGNHSKTIELVRKPVLEDLKSDGSTITAIIHSHAPLQFVEIQYRRMNDNPNANWSVAMTEPKKSANHRYIVEHKMENLEPGKYQARIRASNTFGWRLSDNAVYFGDNKPIQTAGVGLGGSTEGSSTRVGVENLALLSSIFCMVTMRLFAN